MTDKFTKAEIKYIQDTFLPPKKTQGIPTLYDPRGELTLEEFYRNIVEKEQQYPAPLTKKTGTKKQKKTTDTDAMAATEIRNEDINILELDENDLRGGKLKKSRKSKTSRKSRKSRKSKTSRKSRKSKKSKKSRKNKTS